VSNWQPKSCEGCSLYNLGRGFVVGCGDPLRAKIAIILETPANEEINFGVWPPPGNKKRYVLGDVRESQAEMRRRRERYPEIDARLLARGVPVVGRTGAVLNFRLLEQAGIMRDAIFIDNSLRCLPPRTKGGANWPTGNARRIAESHCRQYDRLDEFKPTVIVVTVHPAAIFREVAPELLIVEDLRKAKEFADQGERVLVLMGGKAAETFLGFAGNVSRWRGHYEFVDGKWLTERVNTLRIKAEKARRSAMPKSERPKKKSKAEVARAELATKILDALQEEGVLGVNAGMFEEWTRAHAVVTGVLTPPPRPKKPRAVEPNAPESPTPEVSK